MHTDCDARAVDNHQVVLVGDIDKSHNAAGLVSNLHCHNALSATVCRTVALVLLRFVFELRPLAVAVFTDHKDVFAFVVGTQHTYHGIVLVVKRYTLHARSATAHLAELIFRAADHLAVLRSNKQLACAIGKACGEQFIAFTDANGDDAIGTWTRVSLKAGLLDNTVFGAEYNIVVVQIVLLLEILHVDVCLHLVVGLNIYKVEDGAALRILATFRYFECTFPVAAPLFGKEQDVVVVGSHKDMLHKILVADRTAFRTDTSPTLSAIFAEECALDVAKM